MKLPGCRLACIALALLEAAPASAAIHFADFVNSRDLSLVGNAAVSGKVLRLTTAQDNQAGAAWFHQEQPVAAGFETTFQFQLTKQGGLGRGADGFAFVLQNAGPKALGGRGSAGGFAVAAPSYDDRQAGIPWSIAIFFDTHRNHEEGDPSANYIAFCTYGKPHEAHWPAPRLAFTPKLPVRLKDGKVHSVRILYRPPVLSVFLDDSPSPVLSSVIDLSVVMDREGRAWVGFTASTGAGYEDHDILNWSFHGTEVSSSISVVSSRITFAMSACLPDRKLCTPESSAIERNDKGFHIVLPANLEWGAKVPNQPGRRFVVANAHGIACWDVETQSPDECSGPDGKGTPAGAGFLDPQAPAGALVTKIRDGHTWFSVNGRNNVGFKNNEGFYEFDLEIQ